MSTTAPNGCPHNPRAAASYYRTRGYIPIPLPARSKKPSLDDWPNLRPTEEDLDRLFPVGAELNLGLLLGEPSGGLLDVDLDCDEAVAAAPHLLPLTGMVSGRKGRFRSHWWYIADDPPDAAQEAFTDLAGAMLVELRSTGGQTVVPPSTHETGCYVGWHEFGEPGKVKAADLRRAVARVAAAALIGRHWPAKGSRDKAALALAGGLLRSGWLADDVASFVLAAAQAGGDEEYHKRVMVVCPTAEKLAAGKPITGWRKLGALLTGDGKAVLSKVFEWLGIATKGKKGCKGGGGGGDSIATDLVKIAVGLEVEFFHTAEQAAFARIPTPDHKENWPVRSTGFRRWLARQYYELTEAAASGQALADALGVLEGMAVYEGPELGVYNRLAEHEGKIYLDLADPLWRAVEIDQAGWRVVIDPPVRFRRGKGTLPLPEPARGGKLDDLRPFANVKTDTDWLLLLGWTVAALRPRGPFPVLTLTGEQGTAKSTLGRTVQRVTDPNAGDLRSEPKEVRDLAIAANTAWVIAYDNLSHLPQWLSDALCRLATGGGFGTRQLYTDDEEILFNAKRPVLLTSITDVVTAGDLLDRSASLQLEQIPEDKRKTEAEFDAAFEAARPRILGALLDAVSAGLRTLLKVKLAKLQRMADFQLWAEACLQGAGFKAGAFSAAYEANRCDVNVLALEASAVAQILLKAMDGLDDEEGRQTKEATATDLLAWIDQEADDRLKKQRGWPTRGRDLSTALKRLAPNLRREGITLTWNREPRRRTITISRPTPPPKEAGDSASSASSASSDAPATDAGHTQADTYGDGDDGSGADDSASSQRHCSVMTDPAPDPMTLNDAGVTLDDAEPPQEDSILNNLPGQELRRGYDADDADDAKSRSIYGLTSGDLTFHLVRDAEGLGMAVAAVEESHQVGVDTETTGLNWRTDRVRLLSLAPDRDRTVFLIDCFAITPDPLLEVLKKKDLVLHNAAFDLSFLGKMGLPPVAAHDLLLISRLLTAGTKDDNALKDIAARELGITLDKSHQKDDWTGDLTADQLAYAARDPRVTLDLYPKLAEKIREAGLEMVADIEHRALPAFQWLSAAAAPFDRAAWGVLTAEARREADDLRRRMDDAAPPRDGTLIREGAWNWDSPKDVLEVLRALGFKDLEDTGDETLATIDHPLAAMLRDYRAAEKRVSAYGPAWLEHESGGRIFAKWNQLGTDSGRSSCSRPNLQQVPRDPRYRRCFAAPPGRMLVKADYSQLQLRIAAKVANEKKMLAAYAAGQDLHTLTARSLTGKGEVTKAERQIAKAVNFGLIFGLGAEGLRKQAKKDYGIDLTLEEARRYRAAFFSAYPGLQRWHRMAGADTVKECRTPAGRRCLLNAQTRFTYRLNTPLQGAEADGAKRAMALLWERREGVPGAVPVLFCHDEIVVECDEAQAEAVAAWLKKAMLDGMAPLVKPVRVEVEATVGRTWGGD
jgi:DNA polymerase I-like protein with 3'-5' exonuclease and polymerase domains